MKVLSITLLVLFCSLVHVHASLISMDSVDTHMESSMNKGISPVSMTTDINDIEYYQTDQSPSLAAVFSTVQVPEPATLLLLGSGLIGFSATMRRKLKNN